MFVYCESGSNKDILTHTSSLDNPGDRQKRHTHSGTRRCRMIFKGDEVQARDPATSSQRRDHAAAMMAEWPSRPASFSLSSTLGSTDEAYVAAEYESGSGAGGKMVQRRM